MASTKKWLFSFTMAAMILFPVLNRILDTGVLFLLIPIIFWGIRAARNGFKNTVLSISLEEFIWLCVSAPFAAAWILRLAGLQPAGGFRTGEYAVVVSVVLLYPALKPSAGRDRDCLQIPVMAGLWVLALYFIDTALFQGVMMLFDRGQDTLRYINMAAFLVILMSSGLYLYEADRKMRVLYAAGVAVPALVIAINAAWGTAFLVFVMFVIHASAAVPVAEAMKRLLQLFFGTALLFCNMSLAVHYGRFLHVEGLEYRLECGVAGELFLCLLAAYVFRRWERLPAGADLREVKLTRLQKGCRGFLRASAALLAPAALLALVDGRLAAADMEVKSLVQLMAGDKWEKMSSGVFTVTALSLLEHINGMLVQLWKGNIAAVFHRMYGWLGVTAVLAGAVLLCRRLYFEVQEKGMGVGVWLAAGSLGAMFCLPVTVYMLPVYLMPVFVAAGNGEAEGRKSARDTIKSCLSRESIKQLFKKVICRFQ